MKYAICKTTEHCLVNISSVIGCKQLLGLFRLKYVSASRTVLNQSGKAIEHLASHLQTKEINLAY